MDLIPKSGLYYPNRFALITLEALEEVMGKNGLNAILNMAHLSHLVDNYPPTNLAREFDFSQYSMINIALEEMYGPRGGRGLALRAGRATFSDALRNFGAMAGASDLAFKVLPLQQKLKLGLPAMGKIFSTVSDQHSTVEEFDWEKSFPQSVTSTAQLKNLIQNFTTSSTNAQYVGGAREKPVLSASLPAG